MAVLKTRRRPSTARNLFLEGLESRQLLAGDILASVVNGQLRISGDAADNGILLRSAAGGGVEVVGTSTGGLATTINGGTSSFITTKALKGVSINLGGGNDSLAVSNYRH